MERRCQLCGKTVEELATEELKQSVLDRQSLCINLKSDLCYPYDLCGGCEDFLRVVVPHILEAEGIIEFDVEKDKYTLKKEE